MAIRRKSNKPIPRRHRVNQQEMIRLHLAGKLPKPLPDPLMETMAFILRHHPRSPEADALRQVREDRHPKGTGYGEEKKPKPKDAGPVRKKTKKKMKRPPDSELPWE